MTTKVWMCEHAIKQHIYVYIYMHEYNCVISCVGNRLHIGSETMNALRWINMSYGVTV